MIPAVRGLFKNLWDIGSRVKFASEGREVKERDGGEASSKPSSKRRARLRAVGETVLNPPLLAGHAVM